MTRTSIEFGSAEHMKRLREMEAERQRFEEAQIAAEEAEMGIDYDDRDHCDKERGT
jgi:hypothetical protein